MACISMGSRWTIKYYQPHNPETKMEMEKPMVSCPESYLHVSCIYVGLESGGLKINVMIAGLKANVDITS